jgi:hypothetical protein
MAIGEGMLAQALIEYLQDHAEEFAAFLFKQYDEGRSS